MKRKIYMSVPMSLNWSSVQLFKRRFPEEEFEVSLWDRINYDPSLFKNAKEVVFFLPNWEFSYTVEDLPVGVRRELREAREAGKKIYLGYITRSGDYNIYEAQVDSHLITGKKGTANVIFDRTGADRKNFIYETDSYKVPHNSTDDSLYEEEVDERLLLMLA